MRANLGSWCDNVLKKRRKIRMRECGTLSLLLAHHFNAPLLCIVTSAGLKSRRLLSPLPLVLDFTHAAARKRCLSADARQPMSPLPPFFASSHCCKAQSRVEPASRFAARKVCYVLCISGHRLPVAPAKAQYSAQLHPSRKMHTMSRACIAPFVCWHGNKAKRVCPYDCSRLI